MHVIDPFEFRQMFLDAKSVAIVGNAPTILDYEHGSRIDSHDLVVRFNRATTAGVETKIGSRTDILVVNASNSKSMAPSPTETVKPRCLVTYVSPQGIPHVDPGPFVEWVDGLPILLTFGPDLINLPALHHTRPMTSGTYFLMMLLRMLAVERLFVTGFTMFGAKGGEARKYYKDDRVGVGTHHDLDVESEVFSHLLTSAEIDVEMTPEVAAIVGTEKSSLHGRNREQTLRQRLSDGLAWRFISLGTKLRRIAESR